MIFSVRREEWHIDQEGRANMNPRTRADAPPIVRATPVIQRPPSVLSGRTTAIVYDCLVGTSMTMLKRHHKNQNRQREAGH